MHPVYTKHSYRLTPRMFCAEIVERTFTSFTYLITPCKDITFPIITNFKTIRSLSCLSVNRIPN